MKSSFEEVATAVDNVFSDFGTADLSQEWWDRKAELMDKVLAEHGWTGAEYEAVLSLDL